MFGMTLAFATAGIGQVYLERIIGLGYLETQRKIQVHFLMLTGTGLLFALGVALYLWDFFVVSSAAEPGRERRGLPRRLRSPMARVAAHRRGRRALLSPTRQRSKGLRAMPREAASP